MTFSFQTENFVIQKDTKQGCSAVLNVMVLKSIAAALANNDLFFNKMKFMFLDHFKETTVTLI